MLLIVVLGVVALLLAGLAAEAWTILRASAPARPSSKRLGPPKSGDSVALPRVIWTYWDSVPPPGLVEKCLQVWKRCAPDHEIRLVDRTTAWRWLDDRVAKAGFDALPSYRQSDWLRLQLLSRHGGVWMDGSTLLTASLDWVHRLHDELGAGVVGFYIDRYTTNPHCPTVENWFLAAPASDPFIAAWAKELDCALAMGENAYLEALQRDDLLDAAAQAIPADMRSYLVMHIAAGRVLQHSPDRYRLILQRAEDVAFAFHAALRWRKRHVYARLSLTPAPRLAPALIKLRSGDRAVMEKGLERGLIWHRARPWTTRPSALRAP